MTLPYAPTGPSALTMRDDGTHLDPTTDTDWDDWVSAGRTRNHLVGAPLLDWLDRHGRAKGFTPDEEGDGFDPRTDFLGFILRQGTAFEDGVLRLLGQTLEVTRIGDGWEASRDLAAAQATVEAMRSGAPIIHQGVLRNPQDRTYGSADLLVRSDIIDRLAPGTLTVEEQQIGAPALGPQPWHYRVIDVKFSSLGLGNDGHAGSKHLKVMSQVWVYNAALGRIQGYLPPASYLLGRSWTSAQGRGAGCLERLARVDHDHVRPSGETLEELVAAAIAWVRRVRREGADWDVLPLPSVPELYPDAKGSSAPWTRATASIVAALGELTVLPAVNPKVRADAHAAGIHRWDDPTVTAERLGLTGGYAERCDAVLAANRSTGPEVVFPDRLARADPEWRTPAPLELYVDFETVSALADDFTGLPRMGGQPLIFQVGCGWYEDDTWRFWQRTVDRLTPAAEGAMIGAWVGHMEALLAARGLTLADARVMHWSPAESSNLDGAWNAARTRHPDRSWPPIPWFDALGRIVRAEPVTVRGAFGFGLKPIAKAMRAAGLIETTWLDGPADGMGAMVGAWWCDAEAAQQGTTLASLPLMADIARYNEVDCRAMAEVIRWLRAHR